MSRFTYVPRPPLSNHVEMFWAYDAYGAGHARERVLPNGTSEIVFVLGGDRASPVVCGAHSESFVIETASRPTLLGVHFRPGGAVPFLKVPAVELANMHVSLDALWGSVASELKDRLLAARTWGARFRIVEDALLARLTGPPARHPAVAFALNAIQSAPHAHTIGQLTARIGLSPRRFIEVFTSEVGLTPKVFCRVRRASSRSSSGARRSTGRTWRWRAATTNRRTSSTTSGRSRGSIRRPTSAPMSGSATTSRCPTDLLTARGRGQIFPIRGADDPAK